MCLSTQLRRVWLGYADSMRRHGHTSEARAIFKRAYTRQLEDGGQKALCEAWLR